MFTLPDFVRKTYRLNSTHELASQYQRREGKSEGVDWGYDFLGDIFYTCPLYSFAKLVASLGNVVHGYLFDHKASFTLLPDVPGVPRMEELDFLFGKPLRNAAVGTPEEKDLSRSMINIWTTFAKTGYV